MVKINNRAADVRVLRLVTGEECVVRVEKETDREITVSHIRVFMIDPATGTARPAPILMTNGGPDEKPVNIRQDAIMIELKDVPQDLYDSFVRDTSPIALA